MRPRYHWDPFTGTKSALILDAAVLLERRAGAHLLIAPCALGRTYPSFDARNGQATVVSSKTEEPAGTAVGIVRIMGPLEQRASMHLSWDSDGYDAVASRFQAMLADQRVGSVLLHIDSPGGDAAGCFEAVRRMRAMAAAAEKPVFAYADELAASAAYALATVAEKIYLPPSGTVGSIGVISVHGDESKAFENEGVGITVVKSGARKAEFNSLEPLTAAAREHMQQLVDELAGQFAQVVAESRGGTAKEWLALEGAVAHGADAVSKGLADGVKTFEEVVSMAAAAAEERRESMSTKEINAALGLPEDAPQAATIEAVKLAAQARDALLEATGKDSVPKSLGALDAWKTKVEIAEAYEAKTAAEAVVTKAAAMMAAIDAAVDDGRLPPAKREQVVANAKKFGAEWLESHLALLEPRHVMRDGGGRKPPTPALRSAGGHVDAELAAACKKVGMSVEEYQEWAPKADAYFNAQRERGAL